MVRQPEYGMCSAFKMFLGILKEQLVEANKLPDGVEKTETVAYLTEQITQLGALSAGQTCTIESAMTYSVQGALLSSTTETFNSTCGNNQTDQEKEDVQKVSLVDGVLKLTNSDLGRKKDKSICPMDGDQVVMVFQKNCFLIN